MRALCLLVVVLVSCGGSSSGGAMSSSMSPPIAPGECLVRCENLRPSLQRDFGVTTLDCGTTEILGALTSAACDCIFERQYGIRVFNSSCR